MSMRALYLKRSKTQVNSLDGLGEMALLRPLTKEEAQRLHQTEVEESLAEMKALAQQVADVWISDRSGVQLVADQRR
jgi:hypothetical protein